VADKFEKPLNQLMTSLEGGDTFEASQIMLNEYIGMSANDFTQFLNEAKERTKESSAAPDIYEYRGQIFVNNGWFKDTPLLNFYKLSSTLPATRSTDPEIERASQNYNKLLKVHDTQLMSRATRALYNFGDTLEPDKQYELYTRVQALNEAQTAANSCLPRVKFNFEDSDGDGREREIKNSQYWIPHGPNRGTNDELRWWDNR